MGRFLDALKKRNVDLNDPGSYKQRKVLETAKPILIEYLNKLPESKRYELMDSFLSEKAKESKTSSGFVNMCRNIRDQGPEASRKFLTNNESFGKPWQGVVPHMEERLGAWGREHLADAGLNENSPAEDKAVVLFSCQSYNQRMDNLWKYVDDKKKQEYRRQFLSGATKDPNISAISFDAKGTFAEGKNWEKLAEAIEESLDEASLNEMTKRIEEIKEPKKKEMIDQLRSSVSDRFSDSADKKCFLMQNAMLIPDDELDPDDLKKKANMSAWHKALNPVKKMEQLRKEGKLDIAKIIENSKTIINDSANEKDMAISKKAALHNYRSLKPLIPAGQQNSDAFREMTRHAAELQEDMVRSVYSAHTDAIDRGRDLIDEKIRIIEKEKNGLFLSKRNSPEHDRMTKALRLFNAKLNMVMGKPASQELSNEELEKIKSSDIKDLFDEAKNATFNYTCLKTKNGKGGIIHDDGKARNEASRDTYELLNKLGNRLGIISDAEETRNQLALDILRFRGVKAWEKGNAAEYAAKTIYATSLIHGGASDRKQAEMLSKDNLESEAKAIMEKPEFKQMVKDLGPEGLSEAIINGSGALTLAYANAKEKLSDPLAKPGKPPISAQQERDFWNKEAAKEEAGEESLQQPKGPVA